jgi:phage baseplate assembly protein W|tara:strand:- start:335 stop:754 length:420 start_codon:yes stop_codon:yes gene_type:complete
MAYIVRNVDVLDLKPSTGVGIDLPFNGPTGINTTYTTKDAVKANLLNFILTGKRERVMNPTFGSGVRDLIFEQQTEDLTDQVEDLIIGGVEAYFPQVQINTLNVVQSPDSYTITIYLNYSVINTNIQDELQINLTNGGV